ncbi:unnamed protein product, partial [Meganyctiphanes norvegica]
MELFWRHIAGLFRRLVTQKQIPFGLKAGHHFWKRTTPRRALRPCGGESLPGPTAEIPEMFPHGLGTAHHREECRSPGDDADPPVVTGSFSQSPGKFSYNQRLHSDKQAGPGDFYGYRKHNVNQARKTRLEFKDEECDQKGGKYYLFQPKIPQHRQFLSYEGMGIGTPSQRQKQYTKFQALRASENVIDYKVQQLTSQHDESSLVTKDKAKARKIRTRYGIERIVEDLIQESMARGDFDNLSCNGMPLKYQEHNPYLDTVSHKVNQVML